MPTKLKRPRVEKKFEKLGLTLRPASSREQAEMAHRNFITRWTAGHPGNKPHIFFENLAHADEWADIEKSRRELAVVYYTDIGDDTMPSAEFARITGLSRGRIRQIAPNLASRGFAQKNRRGDWEFSPLAIEALRKSNK